MRAKDPAAVALAKRGAAAAAVRLAKRAAQMTQEERSELARVAANARWAGRKGGLASVAFLLRLLAKMSTDPSGNAADAANALADALDGGRP